MEVVDPDVVAEVVVAEVDDLTLDASTVAKWVTGQTLAQNQEHQKRFVVKFKKEKCGTSTKKRTS